jgi:hypothetical protein
MEATTAVTTGRPGRRLTKGRATTGMAMGCCTTGRSRRDHSPEGGRRRRAERSARLQKDAKLRRFETCPSFCRQAFISGYPPVMETLVDKHFPRGQTAVRPPDRDAATRTGLRVRCGNIAPAGASVDDGGSTAVLTGRVSVQSRKAGRGGDRGGEIAEKKMCHADI